MCVEEGYQFVGIERDRIYAAIAAARIGAAVERRDAGAEAAASIEMVEEVAA